MLESTRVSIAEAKRRIEGAEFNREAFPLSGYTVHVLEGEEDGATDGILFVALREEEQDAFISSNLSLIISDIDSI